MFRVIDEETRKPVDDPALKALRERAVTRLESGALLVTRDDHELPVEHSGAPIVGFDGSLAGAVLLSLSTELVASLLPLPEAVVSVLKWQWP